MNFRLLPTALALLLASQTVPAWAHHPSGPGGGDFGTSSRMSLNDGAPQSFIGVSSSVLGRDSRPWGNRVWGLLGPEAGVDFGKGVSLSASVPLAMSLETAGTKPLVALGSTTVALHHQPLQFDHLTLAWGLAQWAPSTHEDLGLGEGQLGTALRTSVRYQRAALGILASVGTRLEYGQQLRISILAELAASGTIRDLVVLGLGLETTPRWVPSQSNKPKWSAGLRPFAGLRLGPRVTVRITGSVPLVAGDSWSATGGFSTRLGRLPSHACGCDGGVCSCADEH